jgi:RHS repeat-associated protein
VSGPDANLTFTYDGSLLRSEQWSGALVNGTVTRTYNNDLQIETLQVGPQPIDFDYDLDGMVKKAGTLDPIIYTNDGLLKSTALGNITETWTYSPFAEVESYTAKFGPDVLYSYTIPSPTDPTPGRDKLGRIRKKLETIEGVNLNYAYTYDPAGRLQAVGGSGTGGVSPRYDYDANGNRLSGWTTQSLFGGVYDNQDRLIEYTTFPGGTTIYNYTDNGELKSKDGPEGTTTYTYDALGNLRKVLLPNGTPITYLVDGRNRRIGKKEGGILRQAFLYKDQLNPVAELDGAGKLVSEFVYATKANVPDYMIHHNDPQSGQTTTYRIISDHLGSVRLVVNVTDGTIAQRIDYDEFGVVLQDTNPGFQPFGFAGGIYDSDTGLVRFGARDYDPQVGRWTAKDPIRFAAGELNLLGYVSNDPINSIDPSGLTSLCFNIGQGKLSVDPEIRNRGPYDIDATSGRGEFMNDPDACHLEDRGPIPPGEYEVDVNRLFDPNFLHDLWINTLEGDWGDWRVPIVPKGSLDRGGFYLHGGSIPGSAGCIDIGGGIFGNELTNRVLNDLLQDPDGRVPLLVK